MWALQSIILGTKVGLAVASAVVTYRIALSLVAAVGAFDWVGKVVRAVGGAAKAVLWAISKERRPSDPAKFS